MSSQIKPKDTRNGTIRTHPTSTKHFYVYQNSKMKEARIIELRHTATLSKIKKMASERVGFQVKRIFDAITGEEIQSTYRMRQLLDLSSLQVTNGDKFIPHPKVYRAETQDSSAEPRLSEKDCDVIDDTRYIVQDLLQRYWNPQIKQYCYLVRWQNYPPAYDSWEPEENLVGACQHLIDKFQDDYQPKTSTQLTCSKLDNLTMTIRKESPLREQSPVYCVCRTSRLGFMVQCDKCEEWFHGDCVGFDESELNTSCSYLCEQCKFGKQTIYSKGFATNAHNDSTRELLSSIETKM